jgi:hypothetical protein
MTPRQIFDKEHGYTKKECKCDTCMTGDYEGTCDRDYEYKEWLEEFYIKHSSKKKSKTKWMPEHEKEDNINKQVKGSTVDPRYA